MNRIDFRLERELQFRINGSRTQGLLVIGGLRRKKKSGDLEECWTCAWSLAEIHLATAEICGEDPLDAFLNCVRFVRRLIQQHKEIGWHVWWLSEDDEGGLKPVLS